MVLCRYIRVRYNDLVSQDLYIRNKVTRSLFEFIDIPFTNVVAQNVDNFRRGWGGLKNKTEKERGKLSGFFGAYRPDNYNPDHWRNKIKREVRIEQDHFTGIDTKILISSLQMLTDLNKACGRTIMAINYDLGEDDR